MELCDGHDRSVMESICDRNDGLDEGYLFHEACRYCTSPRLVKKIYSYYPDAIYVEDVNSKTPIDIASSRDCDGTGAAVYFAILRLFIQGSSALKIEEYNTKAAMNDGYCERLVSFGAKLKEFQVESIQDAKFVFKHFMNFMGNPVS